MTDVLNKVTSGQADAGLVYVTDAIGAGDKVTVVAVPEASRAVNTYPIAVLKGAENAAAAGEFVAMVTGPRGQKVLAEAGFGKARQYALMPQSWQPIDIYSFDPAALHELYAKYHSRTRGRRLVKALSDALRMPYFLAHLEAAFYFEVDR